MKYTKRACDHEMQAKVLMRRGMLGDPDLIIERLRAVGYYRLSGYWYPFRETDADGTPLSRFRPATQFEEVWERYVFDRKLRLMVMDAVERFEVFMRGQIAYCHSHLHGPFAYAEDRTSLPKPNDEKYDEYITCVKRETGHTGQCPYPFVDHFKRKYGDSHEYLPIWMATKVMNFGTIKMIYDSSSNQVKKEVAEPLGLPPKVVSSWLLTMNFVRNICAHHGRLWNRELRVKPTIPRRRDYPEWHIPETVTNARVFAVLTFCRYSLKLIAPQSSWGHRVRTLIENHLKMPRQVMGFPDEWETSPIWRA
jgi:abortive infection bacteriophage resistance protein